MANYIHSTASQPMIYPIYAGDGQNRATKLKEILIKGKANVMDPMTLTTPTGVVTEVSDADLELLKKSSAFQRHVARGFMRVMNEHELNTKDMQQKDNSAQLMDEDYAMGTDPRTPGSGKCVASMGAPGNELKGVRGIGFVTDNY